VPLHHTSALYRGLIRLGIALAKAAGHRQPKIRHGVACRSGVIRRMQSWGAGHRDPARPLLWIHAASVGEGRQAEAVLRHLRATHGGWQIAHTYFSPSAADFAAELPADFHDCLPWDRRADVDAALDALRPTALVFAKLDVWPELTTRAASRDIPVGLIGGTVSAKARRLRWPVRRLLTPAYRALSRIGAIGTDDAGRLIRLGALQERIILTGDPRYDGSLHRATAIADADPLRRYGRAGPTLVAGSTWPEDHEVLLQAFASVRSHRPDARLVIVPHEPSVDQLDGVDRAAARFGLPNPRRLSGGPPPEDLRGGLLVVDRTGVLPVFYADAAMAYVGGGFGQRGLHSVLEPAAAGVPVLVGPAWSGSPDAGELIRARAAVVIGPGFPDWLDVDSGSTLADASPLAALWLALLRHQQHARRAGQRGRSQVEAGLGAAARSARLIEELISDGQRSMMTPS